MSGLRECNAMVDERGWVLDSLDVSNGVKKVLLMITQKRSLFGMMVDPVRRLQYW